MSKIGVAAVGLLLAIASISFAQEPLQAYVVGGMNDPYSGPTAPGMRFGDVPQVQTGEYAGPYGPGGCALCRGGIPGAPCDPAWAGPCIEWKTVGWYSNWRNHDKGCPGGGHCRGCRSCGSCPSCGCAPCETCY